jgi:lipopolysaccharide cholinephosphotransferase
VDEVRPLTIDQLRERQLRLLSAVADHCERHGLHYYLCAGTLLGAVRHQGYIPWDDDIDLMLPREDFDRLCATFPGPEAVHVSLRSLTSDRHYVLPFAKVTDDRTRIDVESDMISGLGVYIDVFPLDGWCRSRPARLVQRVLLKGLLDVMRVKHMVLGRRRKGVRNVVLALGKVLLAWLPARWVARSLERVAKLGRFDTARDVGVISWGYQESIPVTAYGEPGHLDFEGSSYRVPHDTHTVLSTIYGDYMTLPPAEQQVTHHRFVAYEL